MARVTLGPIVSDASGKTAGTVFSRWKGRNYVRRLVTPANPQSVLQTAQREAMARSVVLWRSLLAFLKTALDVVGTGYQMSGYNWYCSQNVVDELLYDSGKLSGHNADSIIPQSYVAAAGAAGEIDLTWSDPVLADASDLCLLFRKVEPASEDVEWTYYTTVASNLEAATVSGLDTGELYRVVVMHSNAAKTIIGESDSAECLAG